MPNDNAFDEDESEQTAVFSREDLLGTVPSRSARLAHVFVRMDGSDVGSVFTLSGAELAVGRRPESHLHLPYEGISRRHARLVLIDDAYRLEDLGSANGTFVSGVRVSQHVLRDGDVVQFGPRTVFRYSVTDAEEEQMLRQLYEASVRDSLTGAYNRDYMNERLRAEVAYAKRHGTPVSMVLVDVDHFKQVNDTHGHQAGDAVLIALVANLRRILRTEDVFARYGGEEFAVTLRGIDLAGAQRVGERLRQQLESSPIAYGGRAIPCTISVGCASLACCADPSPDALIATADRRLYAAKRGGRNRVIAEG